MKPTKKFLSVLIATQIAFSCFASAVESTKSMTSSKSKTLVATKENADSHIKSKKKKLARNAVSPSNKTKSVKETISSKSTGNGAVAKAKTTGTMTTTAKAAAATEPKEAIENEIESIDQMEAAAVVDSQKANAKATEAKIPKTATSKASGTGTALIPTGPATTSTSTAPTDSVPSFVSYNLSLGATYNTAAEEPKEGERSRYMTYDIIPMTVIGPVKLLAWFMYNQNLVDSKESEWQDFPLSAALAKPYNAGDYITLNPAVVVTVPQTRATKDVTQLNYSVNTNVTIGLNTKTLGWDGVVLNWQTGYTKMNNDFTTSSKGEPITDYRLRQRVNFWYPIYGKLTFKSRLQFESNFSYENQVRNTFMHFVLLEYGFMEKYNVNFGTTNGGPTMSGPNYENSFKFYSETSSELFLGVGADF